MQRHRSLCLTLLSFGWLSCSTPPCPSGTGLSGSSCRRLATSSKSDASEAKPRADAGEGLDGAGSRAEPVDAGGGDPTTNTGGAGAAAGSGGAPSSEPAAGTSAGSRSPSAAMSGSTPTAGRAGSPTIGTPVGGKGGASGAGSSAAGTGGTAAGRGAASAGAGAGGAGRGGAGAPAARAGSASLPSGDWFCVQVDKACSCVSGQGVSGDTCSAPKPPCCFTLLTIATPNCQCWPSDSAECAEAGSGSDSRQVASCPPG